MSFRLLLEEIKSNYQSKKYLFTFYFNKKVYLFKIFELTKYKQFRI